MTGHSKPPLPWQVRDASIEHLTRYVLETFPHALSATRETEVLSAADAVADYWESKYYNDFDTFVRRYDPRKMSAELDKMSEKYEEFLSGLSAYIKDIENIEKNLETCSRLKEEAIQISLINPKQNKSDPRRSDPGLDVAVARLVPIYTRLSRSQPMKPFPTQVGGRGGYDGPFLRFCTAATESLPLSQSIIAGSIRYVLDARRGG